MSQDTHELSTNPDLSSQSSFCFHSPMTKKVKGKGSWPCRKTARITPHQKAMLIDQYFFHHKKIKEVAKELNINYCTAKTIVYTYRKKNHENLEATSEKRCGIKPLLAIESPLTSIVSTVGGKVMDSQEFNYGQNMYQQIFCNFENNETFVEKFLMIKDVEQELDKLNCNYFVEFEGAKAIFWCQQKYQGFVEIVDSDSS